MKPQINYQKWFEASKNKGFEALEILSHASKRLSTTLQNKKITDFNQKDIINFTIKGLYKDKKSWVDIEKINDNMINEILDILKNQIEITNNKEKDFIFEGSLNYPQIKLNNDDFSKIPNQQKNDLFIQLEKELKKQCKYFQKINSICFDECEIEDKIINSKGLKLQTKENVIFISTSCDFYYKETKKEQNVRKVFWEKNFKNINITKYAKMISQKQNQIDEQSVKSNVYPVVFANNAFANLLNSFYNFFNALNIHYNNMQIKNQLNQMIASSKVTIIDDPLHPEAFYKYKFDYEGVACQKKKYYHKRYIKKFYS